ncbi:MAG: DUF374 domain-containing protein [Bacteroidetes bacterium]|nr:DUF374 domain-containing protein [Bacteroidota bacterium]
MHKYTILIYLLKIIAKTWKINIKGQLPKEPSIIAFWHGEMLPVWQYFSKNNFNAVVSLSKDGEILARLLTILQYKLIRGSSSKNKTMVLKKMIDYGGKETILITPDGPRGPRKKLKAGAFIVSQRAQAPLVLLRCKIKNKKIFNKSWDKFVLPLPFTSIDILVIDTFVVPKELGNEEITKLISETETKMDDFDI